MEEVFPDNPYPDADGEKSGSVNFQALDNLALLWSIGIGIGYAFLITFVFWIGYRCFLIWHAYMSGDVLFIIEELRTDLLISTVYFGVAALLRKKGIL